MGILNNDDEILIREDVAEELMQDLLAEMNEYAIAFPTLDPTVRILLDEVVAPLLRREDERVKLVEADMIGPEEETGEWRAEEEILLPHLEKYFSFVAKADPDKKRSYVNSFMGYCKQRTQVQ